MTADEATHQDRLDDAVTLRPMRWWDIEHVAQLERLAFLQDSWSTGQFWAELAGVPDSGHYLVADRGGDVVGYAGLAVLADEGWVQTIAVRVDRRGRGVGAALLAALVVEARRRRVVAVLLEVRVDNAPALGLYERFGFERLAVRRGYYAGGTRDGAVLRLSLQERALQGRAVEK